MAGHKADPRKSLDRVDLLDQIGKIDRLPGLGTDAAIGIHVLSQQHHFFHAVLHEPFDLGYDVLRSAAALPAAGVRHDAVCAEVVAAVHDVDKGFMLI